MSSQCRTTLTTPVKRIQRQQVAMQPKRSVPWVLIVGSILSILTSTASVVWISRYQSTIANYIRDPNEESRAKAHAYIGYPTPTFKQPLIDAADGWYGRNSSSNSELDRLQTLIRVRDTETVRSAVRIVDLLLPTLEHNTDAKRTLLSEAISLVGPGDTQPAWKEELDAIDQAASLPTGAHLGSLSFNPSTATAIVTCLADNDTFVGDLRSVDFQVLDDQNRLWPHFTVTEVDRSFSDASVVILIDRSLSMIDGQRMDQLKNGLRQVLQSVTAKTQMQVVAFDHAVQSLTPFTSDRRVLQSSVDSIQPKGATAIADALNYAIGVLKPRVNAKAIFLCTDGQDEKLRMGLKGIVSRCREADIQVNTLAINHSQLDKAVLEQLANETSGCLAYAEQPNEIVSQLTALVQSCSPSYRVKIFTATRNPTSYSIRLRNVPDQVLQVH